MLFHHLLLLLKNELFRKILSGMQESQTVFDPNQAFVGLDQVLNCL